jgi:hypothetical protein
MELEEFFTYHPIKTENRKKLHELNNQLCLELASLIEDSDSSVQDILSKMNFIHHFIDVHIKNEQTRKWLMPEFERLELLINIHINKDDYLLDNIVKHIQIVRMFVNQGITFDELEELEEF